MAGPACLVGETSSFQQGSEDQHCLPLSEREAKERAKDLPLWESGIEENLVILAARKSG